MTRPQPQPGPDLFAHRAESEAEADLAQMVRRYLALAHRLETQKDADEFDRLDRDLADAGLAPTVLFFEGHHGRINQSDKELKAMIAKSRAQRQKQIERSK